MALRKATLLQLVFMIYAVCAAGPYGLEEGVSASGPGVTLLLLLVMPFLWSIPIALATAELTSMVALSYALPTLAALAALGGWSSWGAQHFAVVGREMGGAWLAAWVVIGGLLSNAALVNVNILGISRLPYAMALDGLLPRFLGKASPATGAPVPSLLLGAVCYSLLTLRRFTDLINIYAFLQAANYIMIYLSLLRLRVRLPDAHRPFKIGGGRWGLALVVVPPMLLSILAVWKGEPGTVAQGLAAVAVGPVVYFLAKRRG